MFDKLKVDTTEIHHLANLLDDAGIPYEMKEWLGGLQIAYPTYGEDFVCSIIQNYASYGGRNGYLEIMGLLTEEEAEYDEVKGWLPAVEVFNRINTHWNTYYSTRSD